MKLVIGIVRPEKANDVLEALYRAEVRGFSISRVQGHGGELDRVETYRGTTVKMGLSEKVRFEIAVSDDVRPADDRRALRGRPDRRGRRRQDLRRPARAGGPHPHRRDRPRRRDAGGRMTRSILAAAAEVDTGDTAWMLAATALVLLMTPALGLFYAGLVRSKNTLNTFMMCVAALAVADGHVGARRLLARLRRRQRVHRRPRPRVPAGTSRFEPRDGTTIPHLLFFAFQATFCIITAALVSGAVVERMRFGPFLVFAALWSVLVYAVLAHWAFGGGWLQANGTLDFAGGVPVEMGSGFSALAAALVVGARKDYGRQALLPHNAVYVLLGAGLLWFGWFGFNGGSGFSTGNAERARVHQHAADAGLHAGRLVRARPDPRPQGDGDRRGDGDHRRLRRDHPGRRLHQPRAGRWCSARSPRCRATRSSSGGRARASTRRSTCSPPTASPGFTGILFIGFFAQESWNGVVGRPALRRRRPARLRRRSPRSRRPVYAFAATFVLLQLIGA